MSTEAPAPPTGSPDGPDTSSGGPLFSLLAASLPQVVWVAAPSGAAEYLNPRWHEFTGLSEAECRGAGYLSALHPDDAAALVAAWNGEAGGHAPFQAECRVRCAAGAYRRLLVRSEPVRDGHGRVARWLNVCTETGLPLATQVPASFERYRLFSQHARDIVLFIRTDGRIVEANQAAVDAYGYTRAELLGMRIHDLRAPATSHLVADQILQADNLGLTFETAHRRKDGSTFAVEVSSRGAEAAGERLLLSVIRDISERERAAAALRQSEAEFRAIFDLAGVGKVQVDASTGRFLRVNHKQCEITGYPAEELLRLTFVDVTHPDDRERDLHLFGQLLRGEIAEASAEKRYVRKDGSTVWVHVTATAVRDSRGLPLRTVAVVQDVTAQRQASEALRESEERLRLALDAGRCGVWDWDIVQGRVTWSERIYEFHGLSPDTFGGTVADFTRLIHPEDAERVSEAIRRSSERGEPYGEEFRIVRPGGEVRWIATNGRVLFGPGGRAVRMLGATTDVTERRAAEEALRDADRRKDEFLAMLAHELRNPLAPIRNATEVMNLVAPTDPALVNARDMISRQVEHVSRLVDDLLDVSRISRGKILLRREHADLVLLVRFAAEDHRPLLHRAGVQLEVHLPSAPLWVEGDPTRLTQMVGNLLHNAAKFTDAGGRVVLRLAGEEGHEAVLTVQDTGIGMEGGTLARLFVPFSQADRSLDRSRGGLGLGLALVKGLADLHGGGVTAASPGLGLGSTFTVRLPLGRNPVQPERRGSMRGISRQTLRILLIEDNADVAESLRMVLDLCGHQVAVAHAGGKGIDTARQFHPDVVVCDIGLPGGMDGYAVAREIRADPELTRATLIALTGYGQEEDQRRTRQAGFDRHLTKPADPATLMQILNSLPNRPGAG